MARGGFRIGAGRKKKPQDPPVKTAALPFISKAEELAIFYKGMLERAAQGKKPTEAEKQQMSKLAAELSKTYETGGENEGKPTEPGDPDAKAFLEGLMASQKVDQKTKIQVANILLPYQHPRKGEGAGKKEEKGERAARAGQGKFAPSKPPISLVK